MRKCSRLCDVTSGTLTGSSSPLLPQGRAVASVIFPMTLALLLPGRVDSVRTLWKL